MRRAMDLIHYVVKDGVLDSGGGGDQNEDWDAGKTVSQTSIVYKQSVKSLYHKCSFGLFKSFCMKYLWLTFMESFMKPIVLGVLDRA